MSQCGNVNYSDYFIGINHNGLGIKLKEFYQFDQMKGQDKCSVVVCAVGNFY